MLFLKEFCTFSQTLQPQSRESFFKTLHNLGVLPALEITLASENRQTKSASIDILLFIVDFSPTMVREHMLQQLNNTEDVSSGDIHTNRQNKLYSEVWKQFIKGSTDALMYQPCCLVPCC